MVFHSTRKVVRYPVLVINNTPIERVTNFNYLGLQLSNDLNWDKHKCVISLKLTKTIGVLNRLRYEYPEEILLTLYNTLILPHLNYCILLWGAKNKNKNKNIFISINNDIANLYIEENYTNVNIALMVISIRVMIIKYNIQN